LSLPSFFLTVDFPVLVAFAFPQFREQEMLNPGGVQDLPDLVVGIETADDAGVMRVTPEIGIVHAMGLSLTVSVFSGNVKVASSKFAHSCLLLVLVRGVLLAVAYVFHLLMG